MFKKETLKNGLTLITAPLKETKTANIFVLFNVGSRFESKKLNGASHFVEHMMFKGTEKRPNTLELSRVLDGVGAEFNAFTGKDYTGYYVKADNKHFALAADVVSDMLLNSKFDEEEVEKEKGVIVEEINMYEDNPLLYVEDLLEQLVFNPSPLAMMIAGSKEGVKAISRNELFNYKNKMYGGKNAVVCVAGNFSANDIKLIKQKFSKLAKGERPKYKKFKENQNKSRIIVKYKDTEQVQVCMGFSAYSYNDKNNLPLQILSVILGGNMSSRLFLSIREKEGLAYYIHSSVNNFQDTGLFYIKAGLDKNRIYQAIKLIIEELQKITKEINDDEIQRAKDYIIGKMAIDLEDSSSMSQWYAVQDLMIGKIETPEQKTKKINEVTAKDILKAANEILNLKKINLAVIGPFKDDKQFKKLL